MQKGDRVSEETKVDMENLTKEQLHMLAKYYEAKAQAYWDVIVLMTQPEQVHRIELDHTAK